MTPKDAADKLRPTFVLTHMPPEDRHHIVFVEAVAAELGVEATAFNLQQVASALDEADIRGDDLHFPLMLYSRQHHAIDGVAASTYYPRHDFTFVVVDNEDQLKSLGSGWVENPNDLPPRGEIPITAPIAKPADLPEPEEHRPFAGGHFDPSNPDHVTRVDGDSPRDREIVDRMKANQDEIKAEQARVDAANKAAADERDRMAALQKQAAESANTH
jgi:hypothetical protein